MTVTVVVGGFFGDEGKGKIISYLADRDRPSIIIRGGAGPNAGHTIMRDGKTYKIRMLPSGFLNGQARVLIGPGVVVNPDVLREEIKNFAPGRAFIDRNCGIIEKAHRERDSSGSLKDKIGSTGSGTGPANADRAMRTLRLARDFEQFSDISVDVAQEANDAISSGADVLVEGTQGTFLSLWHGTYPFVTSKDVTASGICADVGIGPTSVNEVIVVFKAFVTRVGTGPLNGQLTQEDVESRGWAEFGTVTGRPRRAAPFDFDLAKRSVMLNGATQIALTKMDVVFPECAGCTSYDQVSAQAKEFVRDVEKRLGVPVTMMGTGPDVGSVIDRR